MYKIDAYTNVLTTRILQTANTSSSYVTYVRKFLAASHLLEDMQPQFLSQSSPVLMLVRRYVRCWVG